MEVQERSIDVSAGQTSLTLLSNNGFNLTDRYAVVGPSSRLDPAFAHTSSMIRVTESFFNTTSEFRKWQPYIGSKIKVFKTDFSVSGETFYALDSVDQNKMILSPALGFTPDDTFIVEFSDYDASSAAINTLAKAQFCSFDASAIIASASSSAVFTVSTGLGSRYTVGMVVYVQSPDCTRYSPDVKIISVVGDVITIGAIAEGTAANLGFTPSAGDIVQLGGFMDNGQGYRFI
jgi:hypothetical protein